MQILKKQVAEEATGIVQKGTIQFWSEDVKISVEKAKDFLFLHKEVAVPNAGAGSYAEIFRLLGFGKVESIYNGSSAGDWTFGVELHKLWFPAWQENRYPYYGFTYSVGDEGYESLNELIESMERSV